MQVVLQDRVPKLGNKHDVVNVKTGFARNHLIPKNLAVPATKSAIKMAEAWKKTVVAKAEAVIENAKEIAEKLNGITLSFKQKARGEKLYGSIKESDIAEALNQEQKVELHKEMIKIKEPIKTVGEHEISLQLSEDVSCKIKLNIEKED